MATYLGNSELAAPTISIDSHKAWHLLALLLNLGRPTRPPELASMCTLFAASPVLVEFLCSIPNSPLFLTSNHFVTISLSAFVSVGEFVSNSNLILSFVPKFGTGDSGLGRLGCNGGEMWARKRKRAASDFEFASPEAAATKRVILTCFNGENEDGEFFSSLNNAQIACTKVGFQSGMPRMPFDFVNQSKLMIRNTLLVNSNVRLLHRRLQNNKCIEGEEETNVPVHIKEPENSFFNIDTFSNMLHPVTLEKLMARDPVSEPTFLTSILRTAVVQKEAEVDGTNLRSVVDFHGAITLSEEETHKFACKASNNRSVESERGLKGGEEISIIDSNNHGSLLVPYVATHMDMLPKEEFKRLNTVNFNGLDTVNYEDTMPTFEREITDHRESQVTYPAAELSVAQPKIQKSSPKMKTANENVSTPRQHPLCKSLEITKPAKASNEQHKRKRDHMSIFTKQKSNQSSKTDMYIKEKKENTVANPPKDQLEPKILPNFESFIVEEEEGSGGYGTVYRALRKSDQKMFAIKCPHANAHRHHVNNELKMLERFGGKNFIIKYEGSFKNENSDCFILEHVDHDRPEVLKREIDVFQLQWYGYCMFRALASLHKQGIVHRDVKPGNFLFSRKVNKGYLIDFNLAMDLHQKYGTTNKSKAGYDAIFDHVPLPHTKSGSATRSRKFMHTDFSEAVNSKAARASKLNLELKNLKNKAVGQMKAHNDLGSRNSIISQGADGSGITSAKDVTSNKTPSAERLGVFWQGTRKELNYLAQEACQIPHQEVASVPISRRKRVAAPPVKMDREVVYLTPMPLHPTVGGVGVLKNKGDIKHKKEGPCVGTKGFRAPEVLFRSQYQGPKIDVWSAGVTLLYLMIGRMPFVGDPDQNIKDIAKLRGSEDLWEVAKLHGRESSFPEDLFDKQCLPSMKLREWSELNTKRLDFLQKFSSLFDLVDKCLMVNPRLRISAEEALKHEFFTPCHEAFKKQRQHRQGQSSHAGSNRLLRGQNAISPLKVSQQ